MNWFPVRSRVARLGNLARSSAGMSYRALWARLRKVRLGNTPSYSPPHLKMMAGLRSLLSSVKLTRIVW